MFSSNTSQTSGGYEIQRSLRFNSADSAYLNRTPASATNQQTWTYSTWIKRGSLDTNQFFFQQNSGASDTGYFGIFLTTGNTLSCQGWISTWRVTAQVFRDVSAWYHIVVAVDTTQATANNRIRIYVNGSEVTSFTTTTNPTQNSNTGVNGTGAAAIGKEYNSSGYFDGYMTEVNFIDGQALTPSSFGAFDAQTGVWGPTPYAGSYGTNGFYLNFSDNSNTTAATLGKDYSGNGNNWTPNNFSVSAGAGNDSLVDVPTNWGTDTGVGGSVRGNYATLNPLNATPSPSISNGNLYQVSTTSGHMNGSPSTIGVSSGKWYAEVVFTRVLGSTDSFHVGLADATYPFGSLDAGGWFGRFWYPSTGYAYSDAGTKINSNSATSYGASYTQGDVIGIAFDADAGTLTFYKNGTSQGVAFTGITGTKMIAASCYKDTSITLAFDINFGQRPFAYTAPSGFKALNTQNLPTPTIGATTATQAGKFFNPVIYSGDNSSTRTLTGVGFQPDLVWLKTRNLAYGHLLYDAIRGPSTSGASKALSSNSNGAEGSINDDASYGYLSAFTSDGFSVVKGTQTNTYTNSSGDNYVAWNWKAGDSNVTNTAGSITSTVRANTTSGFSVVTYTGNGAGATVGHGLGAAPKMVIIKSRSAGGSSPSYNWVVYTTVTGSLGYLFLNTTAAINSLGAPGQASPTSSVFSLSTNNFENQNSVTYVAYCFAEISGFSKAFSYTGNGSADGPFVFCGFRPAYVMYKRTDTTSSWSVLDDTRSPSNAANLYLIPDSSSAEVSGGTGDALDFLSNGFKVRATGTGTNASGGTYIGIAFAESPFKYSLAR